MRLFFVFAVVAVAVFVTAVFFFLFETKNVVYHFLKPNEGI